MQPHAVSVTNVQNMEGFAALLAVADCSIECQ